MKAFLIAHIFLAPFIIFTIGASLGYPLSSALIGLFVGVVFCGFQYGIRIPSAFIGAQLLGLATVLLLMLTRYPDMTENSALALVFVFLALGALISVLQKKPWTAELSENEMGEFAKNPIFLKVNDLFSLMWMFIYAWFAFASWQSLSPWLRWVPLAIGGLISIVGPKILMRIGIKRGMFEDPRTSNSR